MHARARLCIILVLTMRKLGSDNLKGRQASGGKQALRTDRQVFPRWAHPALHTRAPPPSLQGRMGPAGLFWDPKGTQGGHHSHSCFFGGS